MKISLQWIKEFADVECSNAEIIQKITSQIGEVEGTESIGEKYEGVVVGSITEVKDHPDADKLGLYKVDIGKETVQVVAGDKSLQEGDSVAYIPPGTVVPATFDTEDVFVIEKRELRGQESNGMLGSAKELGFSDDHKNVMVLDESADPGTPFVELYGLDDVIIEIENKALTHRPDCFGVIGFAREVAGVQDLPFKTPEWFTQGEPETAEELDLSVVIKIPEACPRFTAQAFSEVTIKPSPLRVQTMLNRIGIRPISNVVDLTNYMMVLTGQPFHAFDYDEVDKRSEGAGAAIVVRFPEQGEKITLLDEREIEPHENAAMVATESTLLSVGGSMGGAETEVTESTTRVILEAANWDLYSIRRTSMKHGIFTEAVTRFARGQDPNMAWPAQVYAAQLLKEWSGAKTASALVDDYPEERTAAAIVAEESRINALLGTQLSKDDMVRLLSNVELDVAENNGTLDIVAPTWRADLHIEEDIAEEVGRLYGYDNIEVTLPYKTLRPVNRSAADVVQTNIRQSLKSAGANEQLSYNFISEKMASDSGFNADNLYRLRNALSPELLYLRPALLPSVIANINPNHRLGTGAMALFEINKAHSKQHLEDDNLPHERNRLALVFSADEKTASSNYSGAGFYQAKAYLDHLMRSLGVGYVLDRDTPPAHFEEVSHVFLPDRSGHIKANGHVIGTIGEFNDDIHRAFKLPLFAAGFEIDLEALLGVLSHDSPYRPISKYPSSTQDVTFQVPSETPFAAVYNAMIEQLSAEELNVVVQPHDIYQSEEDSSVKNLTYRIVVQHQDRTLRTSEINDIINNMSGAIEKEFLAKRI